MNPIASTPWMTKAPTVLACESTVGSANAAMITPTVPRPWNVARPTPTTLAVADHTPGPKITTAPSTPRANNALPRNRADVPSCGGWTAASAALCQENVPEINALNPNRSSKAVCSIKTTKAKYFMPGRYKETIAYRNPGTLVLIGVYRPQDSSSGCVPAKPIGPPGDT